MAHHLLCDGRGLLELVKEFAACYVKDIKPVYVEESLIKSIDDLQEGSDLPWISKIVINNANKHWKKERQFVAYKDYLQFEQIYAKKHPLHIKVEKQSENQLEALKHICQKHHISINDYLVAEMMLEHSTMNNIMNTCIVTVEER